MPVIRNSNVIHFEGTYRDVDLHSPLVCMYQAVHVAGFRDLVLDFSNCAAAFPGPMLALCAEVLRLRSEKIGFEVDLPKDYDLARLFVNANWAHYLEPERYEPSKFRGYTQVPATRFSTPEEQNDAVNRIINAILGGIPDIRRSDFAALEWAINELTDNVIVHSQSSFGGLVQVSNFRRTSKIVEFTIADGGIGIPNSLRSGGAFAGTDDEALDRAIREGVTRDRSIGQGNGLFGSYQICSLSGGAIQIESGHSRLWHRPPPFGMEIRHQTVPVHGTLVIAKIDFSNPDLLDQALRFAGRRHVPVDFIETRYEDHNSNVIKFRMTDESSSFGSRLAGTPVNTKLQNLIRMCPGQPIEVDLDGLALISSSFADEVFGKLFVRLGALGFMRVLRFKNVEPTVQALIDRAIAQRLSTG